MSHARSTSDVIGLAWFSRPEPNGFPVRAARRPWVLFGDGAPLLKEPEPLSIVLDAQAKRLFE